MIEMKKCMNYEKIGDKSLEKTSVACVPGYHYGLTASGLLI